MEERESERKTGETIPEGELTLSLPHSPFYLLTPWDHFFISVNTFQVCGVNIVKTGLEKVLYGRRWLSGQRSPSKPFSTCSVTSSGSRRLLLVVKRTKVCFLVIMR